MIMHTLYSILGRLEHLRFEHFALLTLAIVVLGVYCMRGFGPRSNY